MRITILNGNPRESGFDAYLEQINKILEQSGNQVKHIHLRDLDLKYCVGCWGCWVKTPGLCQADEASQLMDEVVINADFVLWAAPMKMGYPSELLKMALDKHLPLIHPYMAVDRAEAHHRKRYPSYPLIGLVVEREAATDQVDLRLVTEMCQRTALNFKSRLKFSLTSETTASELAQKILNRHLPALPMPAIPLPTQGNAIQPPNRITMFNGSPRGPQGSSPIFLEQFAKGFGGQSQMLHLVKLHSTDEHVKAFVQAEAVWITFPLYTDAMPGIVKHFFEALEPLVGRPNNPPVGFIVQSGFPEGLHSRFVEHYLEKLALRLGSPYLGTIVKGNGEGVNKMPDEANRKLFENLQALGKGFARGEKLNPVILAQLSIPERFPAILAPLFEIVVRLPSSHAYFDNMLKENGAYEQRFDQPFVKVTR
jgi:NAD(P)H-dependent FMN reductase